ncbi:enolase 4-like isoform X2 [Convolutriloba macropyga]|uniref:enolase 4-like isoform X2 n=1 Tax=Convolutriloba macropyga TaxID=536237 RepID=UPI003F51C107
MVDPRTDPQFQKLAEMRRRAVQYYKENQVPQLMESALNQMFFHQPQDVYAYLVEFFQQHAQPTTIDKVEAGEYFDAKGQPTLQSEIYTLTNAKYKRMGSAFVASFNQLSDATTTERKEQDDEERLRGVRAAIKYINGPINEALKGTAISDQAKVDEILNVTLKEIQEQDSGIDSSRRQEAASSQGDSSSQLDEMSPGGGAITPVKNKDTKGGKDGKKGGQASGKDAVPKTPDISEAPKDLVFSGAQAVCSVSSANCLAASRVRALQPFQYISEVTEGKIPEKFRMPIPMVTVLSGGRSAAGKQNLIREVLLLPKPSMELTNVIQKTKDLMYKLINDLSKKLGGLQQVQKISQLTAKMISDHGSPNPMMDKPEQLLDAVIECAAQIPEINLGEDFFIVLHCAAHEYYDPNKEKYEWISSGYKSGDELVETVYLDLLTRYPSVIGLIDPLVQQDKEAWLKLYSAVGDKCFILGERSLGRADQLKTLLTQQQLQQSANNNNNSSISKSTAPGAGLESTLPLHGSVLQFNHSTTVTDIVQISNMIKEQKLNLVLSASPGDTTDTLLVDLAVGAGAHFVKLGGFCRGERACKYNRLIEIGKYLDNSAALIRSSDSTYSIAKNSGLEEEANGNSDTDNKATAAEENNELATATLPEGTQQTKEE